MVLAYLTGAKFFVVFNYPKILRYGILAEEHFEALKRFWKYINNHPEKFGEIKSEVVYVLPEGYGFGFRHINDTIWGLWNADTLSQKIWDDINALLQVYGPHLDIVYNDRNLTNEISYKYKKLFFWNETIADK
jgi:hypothetical protein